MSAYMIAQGQSLGVYQPFMLIFSSDSSVKEKYRSNCVRKNRERNASVKTLAPPPPAEKSKDPLK